MKHLPLWMLIPMLTIPAPEPTPEALRTVTEEPPYPLDMGMEGMRHAIRPSAEHFGHVVPVEIGEGFARRLRELVEAPGPPVVMATTAEEAAQALDVLSQQLAELPTFHAPPRGRVVAQAQGPNRQQRRARR